MRTLKIAGAAVVAVIVVIALLLFVGVPSGFLTSAIQERVERETGYKLAINGSTRIAIWPQLNVTMKDVTLADPKDRDITNRLTAASIEADVTLASVWSGKPEITELVIVRPVLNLPLQRERSREIPAKPAGATAAAFSIEHVVVTGGTVVFSNLRDRVENRIEGINVDAIMTDNRKVRVTGNARSGQNPLKFDIKATAPVPPLERQNIPTEFNIDAPGLLPASTSGKAEIRLNGSTIQINGLSGMLGDGAFNGWASVDVASKPLVKLDLDFHRLNVAMTKSAPGSAKAPWSNATIDINGLNYVDAQARISAAQLNLGDTQFAPAAIEANLASGVLSQLLRSRRRVVAAFLHPEWHRGVEPGCACRVRINVRRHIDAFRTRRIQPVDACLALAPILLPRGLHMIHLHRRTAALADLDQLVDRFEKPIGFAPHMRDVTAAVFVCGSGQRNEFVRVGEVPRRIDQRGTNAHRALAHRLTHEVLHALHLIRRRLTVIETNDVRTHGRSAYERGDVRRYTLPFEKFEILAQRRPRDVVFDVALAFQRFRLQRG